MTPSLNWGEALINQGTFYWCQIVKDQVKKTPPVHLASLFKPPHLTPPPPTQGLSNYLLCM